jgi:2-C-methyl-D-erythritol 4-phosphate cytidylyltransferase
MAQRLSVAVVVAAAGGGHRLGRGPKALVPLAGRPLLAWALTDLAAARCVGGVIVVAPVAFLSAVHDLVAAASLDAVTRVVPGGPTRQASVARGLAAVPHHLPYVAVHDAARPAAGAAMLDRLLEALLQDPARPAGVAPGIPIFDTVHRVLEGESLGVVERGQLRAIQTPQLFPRAMLEEAYRTAAREGVEATDDATLVERMGGKVKVIPGCPENFKITIPHDLLVAEAVRARSPRASVAVAGEGP